MKKVTALALSLAATTQLAYASQQLDTETLNAAFGTTENVALLSQNEMDATKGEFFGMMMGMAGAMMQAPMNMAGNMAGMAAQTPMGQMAGSMMAPMAQMFQATPMGSMATGAKRKLARTCTSLFVVICK